MSEIIATHEAHPRSEANANPYAPMPERITDNDAQYALNIVKTICTQVGPGMPGTSQERERAAIIEKELISHLGSGNVRVEEFTVAPWAFLSAYPLSALFMLIAALLNIAMGRLPGVSPWITAIPALAFAIIAPLLFIFEFILGVELVDLFFRREGSVNVVGRLCKPGTTNVKRLLNFETIAHPEITILTSDVNGTVKNSPEMVKSVVAAAERAGVPYKLMSAYLGVGNDSGPFSQAGLKAATLLGFKVQQMVEFYHQEWDTPEILSIEPMFNVLKLTFEWVCNGGE